jgi:sec-independent protein translocase protein TatA
MFAGLQGWHLLIILAVIVLLFGAPKLPQMARSLGQSMRIFKSEVKTMKEEGSETDVKDGTVKDSTVRDATVKDTTTGTTPPDTTK